MLSFIALVHLIGLALALGCATAKLTLLLRCTADPTFMPVYQAAARSITRLIIAGLVLLTLSGVGWILSGFSFTSLLIVKLVLVATIWVLGPIIDTVVEPRFMALAPRPGEQASTAFIQIQRYYVWLEAIATGLFYVIIMIWVLA